MKQIEADLGQHVADAAQRLIDTVKIDGRPCFLVFNNVCLTANRYSTVESICEDYDLLTARRTKEYAKSPEAKAAKKTAEADRKRLQTTADTLMQDLPHLDFNNVGNLLDWLGKMEEPRDRLGVEVDAKQIQDTFAKYGYFEGMNCGADFDANDREVYAKWLIGQALVAKPYPMIRHFTSEWRMKFHRNQQ